MNDEVVYQLALSQVPGIGPTVAKTLVSYCGSAKKVFNTPPGKLGKIPGVGSKLLAALRSIDKYLPEAEALLIRCLKEGINVLNYTDPSYPYRLKQIADAPNIIFFKGGAELNNPNCLAIVGTRKATPYGKAITEQFIEAWATYNPLIISGLAYGIDITAHRAAIRLGLPTVGVMASGIDITYPSAHSRTAFEMLEKGGLLTEHPFGTKPDAYNFPARNRIIAGMAQATVVIEAAEKGGALITAYLARDYDREVFAVPGSLQNEYSVGCHRIIQQQIAHIMYKPESLPQELGWKTVAENSLVPEPDFSSLPEPEKKVAELLKSQPEGIHIDTLVYRSGLPYAEIPAILLSLEFGGWVRVLPGKKYQLIRK